MFCTNCGKEVIEGAAFCQYCGEKLEQAKVQEAPAQETLPVEVQTQAVVPASEGISKKSRLAAMLLGIFLGNFGVHNFYLRRFGRAVTQLILTVFAYTLYFAAFINLVLEKAKYASAFIPNHAATVNALQGFGMVIPLFIMIILGVGIWSLVEWILIASGKAKDGNGLPVKKW
ncbi:MAG: TM2 domain-containing protein [Treponema sp.]|nr:TM2 domain-containing protein [Treponema sp.]